MLGRLVQAQIGFSLKRKCGIVFIYVSKKDLSPAMTSVVIIEILISSHFI